MFFRPAKCATHSSQQRLLCTTAESYASTIGRVKTYLLVHASVGQKQMKRVAAMKLLQMAVVSSTNNKLSFLIIRYTRWAESQSKYLCHAYVLFSKQENFNIITQNYLESGHKDMEVDSMHGYRTCIEKKHTDVICATEWLDIFKRARSNVKSHYAQPRGLS